jgi:hypothetical protein
MELPFSSDAITYINFGLLVLIVGVVIWQSIKVEDMSSRMADYERMYAQDQLKYIRNIRDLRTKTDDIVRVLEMQSKVNAKR